MKNILFDTENYKKIFGKDYIRVKLSVLWLFVMLNYIYADILTLMDSTVLNDLISGEMEISQEFLFLGAILMELPIAMVVLSLCLKYRFNRVANIVVGSIKTLAVFGSLFVGDLSLYYLLFAIIEITFTSLIVWTALKWSYSENELDTSIKSEE